MVQVGTMIWRLGGMRARYGGLGGRVMVGSYLLVFEVIYLLTGIVEPDAGIVNFYQMKVSTRAFSP